ncbi:MAG: glycosyltransferase family 1 protein [Candidatus Kuenenbacteria bacterium]
MSKNKKLLIGVDASRSVSGIEKTGVEKVSDELLSTINKQLSTINNGDVDFIFYAPKIIEWLPESKHRIFGTKRLWTVLGLSFEMLRNKPDVLFVPVHTLPFFCPKRTVKIIHDIAFVENKQAYSFWQRMYLNFDLWRCARICEKIIVPTEKVKKDLLKYTGVNEDKIVVIKWGYNTKALKHLNTETLKHVDDEIYRRKQILYLGRVEEKKNIFNLIKGFEIFNKKYGDYKLILAGKAGKFPISNFQFPNNSQIKNSKFKIQNSKFLGYISDEEKYKLLQESSCLVLVSKDEGFGIPILEAFDFELPVLASDIPALREVGKEACMYVDPNNPESIAQGLDKIAKDNGLREKLISKGRERLKKFNWETSLKKVLDVLL